MLIMEFDVILLQFLSNKLEIFVSCNLKLFALCFYMYFFNKNLIVLHHSGIIFYFDICIKFTLSTVISRMKEC